MFLEYFVDLINFHFLVNMKRFLLLLRTYSGLDYSSFEFTQFVVAM